MLLLLNIVQMTQSGLGLRQRGDTDVQHLKQDIRRHVEDQQEEARVQDTRGKKPEQYCLGYSRGRLSVVKHRQICSQSLLQVVSFSVIYFSLCIVT